MMQTQRTVACVSSLCLGLSSSTSPGTGVNHDRLADHESILKQLPNVLPCTSHQRTSITHFEIVYHTIIQGINRRLLSTVHPTRNRRCKSLFTSKCHNSLHLSLDQALSSTKQVSHRLMLQELLFSSLEQPPLRYVPSGNELHLSHSSETL